METILDKIENAKWNGKIYGGKEKSIYLNGEKVVLSNDDAELLNKEIEGKQKIEELKSSPLYIAVANQIGTNPAVAELLGHRFYFTKGYGISTKVLEAAGINFQAEKRI
jgi:hypothetical protein